jgi:hypothetical protein
MVVVLLVILPNPTMTLVLLLLRATIVDVTSTVEIVASS